MSEPAGAGGVVGDLDMETTSTSAAVRLLATAAAEYRSQIGPLLSDIEAGELQIGSAGFTDVLAVKFAAEYNHNAAHLKELINRLGGRLDTAAFVGREGIDTYTDVDGHQAPQVLNAVRQNLA